ncbi:MAG: TraB/GumN family protein [Bacteroidetes bacterium]|nr:TraB/GumN family protein [Bacteroidota bacterium]
MKNIIRRILLICTPLIFGNCKAQKPAALVLNKDSNTLLWQVSGNNLKNPSYLFGTFHLLCKEDIYFSEPLKQAISRSKEVYMELDMDDPATMMGGVLYMNMKNGKSLSDLYSPEDYEKLKTYFSDSLKVPLGLLSKAKPFFLIALLYPRMMNCTSPAGVEEELMKIAKAQKKEIKGLETIQFQASVFDSIPYEWQAKELLKNIDSFSFYKKEFDKMVSFYKAQKLDSMGRAMKMEDTASDKYNNLLLIDRNKNWVAQLKKIMAEEPVFVAVGAGHLMDTTGLIALLKKEGYKVEPLKNN